MSDYTVFDIETTGRNPFSASLLVAGIGDHAYAGAEAKREMVRLFKRPGVIVEHTMFDARWAMLDGCTLGPRTEIHDTRHMAWLLNPDETGHLRLEDLMLKYFGEEIVKPIRTRGGKPVWDTSVWPVQDAPAFLPLDEVPTAIMQEYNEGDLDEGARLYEVLRERLEHAKLWDLYLDREVEIGITLAQMEAAGIPFRTDDCELLRASVQKEADELKEKLRAAVRLDDLNLGSPAQLGRLLFTPKGQRVEFKHAYRMSEDQARLVAETPKDERLALVQRRSFGLPRGFEPASVGRMIVQGVIVGKGLGLKTAEHGFGSSKHWEQQSAKHKNPSTSSVSLVLSNPTDPWVADLVFWRELDKLAGSFLSRFPTFVSKGRLYGNVNRCGTVTGRLSSSEPNLQNIPAHGTYGALVRSLFAGDLIIGDYAQLEQRIATHYCEDERMLQAYRENVDLYGLAASVLFGGDADKKHPQRGLMKTGMLGIQYGAGAGKLAQLVMIDDSAELEFNVTGSGARAMAPGQVSPEMKAAAQKLIDQLREVFPRFFQWREDAIYDAIVSGTVVTLGGRRRLLEFPHNWAHYFEARRDADRGDAAAKKRMWRLREGYSEDESMRGFMMERQALNTLCQGGGADVVAGAMVAVDAEMRDRVKLLVQVHDEMLWERLRTYRHEDLQELRELCETGHGFKLAVPIIFEPEEVATWADKGAAGQNAHGLFTDRMKRNRSEGLQSRKASDLARSRQQNHTPNDTRQLVAAKARKARETGSGGLDAATLKGPMRRKS